MKNKERMIAIVAGGFLAVTVLYFIVSAIRSPITGRMSAAQDLRQKIQQLKTSTSARAMYDRQLIEWAGRTFPGEQLQAEGQFRERLATLLKTCELSGDLKQQAGTAKKGAYREVAWSLSVPGSAARGTELARITQLLYLLHNEPYICRVENINVTPRPDGTYTLDARCLTIVLDVEGIAKYVPASGPAPDNPTPPAQNPAFGPYQVIASRNLFRPYIPPPPPRRDPPPPRPEYRPPPPPPPPPSNPDERFRIVSLSQWGPEPEIWVTDLQNNSTRKYKAGERLAGGQIVMIDYRPLPRPDKPELDSPSRVIVKVLDSYYASELHQTLNQKRRLPETQWPPDLRAGLPAGAEKGAGS